MPSINLHPRPSLSQSSAENPLPLLLHTPSGLALLELQATIHHETPAGEDADQSDDSTFETPIGRLLFPDYSPQNPADDTRWMKRAYLYIGRYQRMTGEVKKLGKPIAIVRRRPTSASTAGTTTTETRSDEATEELEIVDIVRFKVIFANRPEPVNDA